MWFKDVITVKIKGHLFVMGPLNLVPDPLGHMDTPLKITAMFLDFGPDSGRTKQLIQIGSRPTLKHRPKLFPSVLIRITAERMYE